MRRAARTDGNHKSILAALERAGWEIVDLSRVGQGVPDLLAVRASHAVLIEIKDGAKSASRRQLTDQQRAFHTRMALAGWAVWVVTSDTDERIWGINAG